MGRIIVLAFVIAIFVIALAWLITKALLPDKAEIPKDNPWKAFSATDADFTVVYVRKIGERDRRVGSIQNDIADYDRGLWNLMRDAQERAATLNQLDMEID